MLTVTAHGEPDSDCPSLDSWSIARAVEMAGPGPCGHVACAAAASPSPCMVAVSESPSPPFAVRAPCHCITAYMYVFRIRALAQTGCIVHRAACRVYVVQARTASVDVVQWSTIDVVVVVNLSEDGETGRRNGGVWWPRVSCACACACSSSYSCCLFVLQVPCHLSPLDRMRTSCDALAHIRYTVYGIRHTVMAYLVRSNEQCGTAHRSRILDSRFCTTDGGRTSTSTLACGK